MGVVLTGPVEYRRRLDPEQPAATAEPSAWRPVVAMVVMAIALSSLLGWVTSWGDMASGDPQQSLSDADLAEVAALSVPPSPAAPPVPPEELAPDLASDLDLADQPVEPEPIAEAGAVVTQEAEPSDDLPFADQTTLIRTADASPARTYRPITLRHRPARPANLRPRDMAAADPNAPTRGPEAPGTDPSAAPETGTPSMEGTAEPLIDGPAPLEPGAQEPLWEEPHPAGSQRVQALPPTPWRVGLAAADVRTGLPFGPLAAPVSALGAGGPATIGPDSLGGPDNLGGPVWDALRRAAEPLAESLPRTRPRPVIDPDRPRVALVIDDLGIEEGRTLRTLELPARLTTAFLPYGRWSRDLSAMAGTKGHEVLLHLPMEPLGPEDPGPNALLTDLSDEEFDRRLAWALAQFDGYDGFNNHMGSRLTESRVAMERVMAAVRDRDLYFLDSLTSGASVAYETARRAGLRAVVRHVFLDHSRSPKAIRRQLERTLRIADRTGYAIAIGHPHVQTLEALEEWIPASAARGVQFVTVSSLLDEDASRRLAARSRAVSATAADGGS